MFVCNEMKGKIVCWTLVQRRVNVFKKIGEKFLNYEEKLAAICRKKNICHLFAHLQAKRKGRLIAYLREDMHEGKSKVLFLGNGIGIVGWLVGGKLTVIRVWGQQ